MDKFIFAQGQFPNVFFWFTVIAVAWSLPWKGVALWKAAQNRDRCWFVALLLINTLAMLDILYTYVWSKKKK
ncbi:MAG: hypothetical protein A2831_02645 [Candidatus Yanofskybacteria bacterium RIFCSPHIGHO2_01_FULL_44_17]|uniref:DUF5652 domain-containing protein n=1 Tax=Candidatus Yanofskybacteria bacterium RIFCSPHIGHO2_01_FULL_44_17 TaxID=1802668 RepID=A0A1F8EY12_9BACT|nr:MAG: hypothetical protein A2831_02645 [Candidatus Yanofskybacteria bacterium RIFCSPHIGHO2_01_FULL_44_17]